MKSSSSATFFQINYNMSWMLIFCSLGSISGAVVDWKSSTGIDGFETQVTQVISSECAK
jgi:hypothetical protein